MRVAVLLNAHAIEHEQWPLSFDDWSDLYRTFLDSCIARYNTTHDTVVTLECRYFDVIGAREYPDSIDSWDAILLTGGTQVLDDHVPWVNELRCFIRAVVREHHVKVVSLCWNHQALAATLDGDVSENEKGAKLGVETLMMQQQVHGRVVTRVPAGFQSLGKSEASIVQGILCRDRVLTCQDHSEATEYMTRACLSCASQVGAESAALEQAAEGNVAHDGPFIGGKVIEFILGTTFKQVSIHPALFNSSSPWSSSMKQIRELYDCPSTGAVTIRTATMTGFMEDHTHKHSFQESGLSVTSYNSYGFSPHPLSYYLDCIRSIYSTTNKRTKPFIVSIGGSDDELCEMLDLIQTLRESLDRKAGQEILVELNLSCPNIPSHPPPSYSRTALTSVLQNVVMPYCERDPSLILGLKITPFTYLQQFTTFLEVLSLCVIDGQSPITYIAATNTLGGALPLANDSSRLLPGSGVGGMAGHAIHAISLGTVSTLSKLLSEHVATEHIKIVGIGGVCDSDSCRHMKQVGASAVALASALGHHGLQIFEAIIS